MSNINIGNCYYCDDPVVVGEGQSIKHIVRINVRTGERLEYPTHKPCRKQNGV